jgi:hypothetical protein
MTTTFKLDTTKLDAIIKTSPQKVANVVTKTAMRILGEARINAPRDPNRPPNDPSRQVSGALKANSDVVEVDIRGLTQNIEFYVEYALAQELGRPEINLPARPYLTPATEKMAKGFVEDLKDVLDE